MLIFYRFYIVFDRKHVATAKKKGLVQIEVLHDRKRKYITTGVKLYSDQWDIKRNQVINSLSQIEYNEAIYSLYNKIQTWYNDLMRNGKAFSFEALDDFLLAGEKQNIDLLDFLARAIDQRNDIRESTRKAHKKLISTLKRYGKFRYVSDLTRQNIAKFDNWLHGEGLRQPTIHDYHKILKRYIKDAILLEYLEQNPYENYTISRGEYNTRKYLTLEQLQQLENAEIPLKTVEKVRDLFVFQAYTGLAYADLVKFDFTKVIEHNGKFVLHDIRQKSSENYYIVLLKPAINVLKRYNYVLPIISNQQYNLRLKLVADYAKLDIKLTTHMARHTFAVLCLNNGVKIENLAKMMGHTDIKTTQIYAKVLNSEVEKEFLMLEQKLSK